MFERTPNLKNAQIVNYHVNHDLTWLALVGTTTDATQRVIGHIQLFSTEKKISQAIEGHAVSFSSFNVAGKLTTRFCFATRNDPNNANFFVFELGNRFIGPLEFPSENPQDFPVALEISEKYRYAKPRKILRRNFSRMFLHLFS